MSRLAANPAAPPSLALRMVVTANPRLKTDDGDDSLRSSYGVFGRSNAAAIEAIFFGRDADENFGPVSVCRYVSRLLHGHCFGAYPAPGGSSLFCFDCVALRVTVSCRTLRKCRASALGSRAHFAL
jgi:hypothetical protein